MRLPFILLCTAAFTLAPISNARAQQALHGAAANPPHAAADSAGIEFFETKVRPALAKYCFECHSQKASKAMGGLTLDSRKAMMVGGKQGPALAAFAPDSSRLIEAVRYKNPDMQMPPSGKIPDSVIEDIAAWISNGRSMAGDAANIFNGGTRQRCNEWTECSPIAGRPSEEAALGMAARTKSSATESQTSVLAEEFA